ncbi:MAG: gamma-glutamylcyclotransferase family protein [Promethearchaeota archaeon]
MNSVKNDDEELISVIGYGTFLTKGLWKNKKNVEPCLVKDHVRILPEGKWYPFVLEKKGESFWALKFSVSKEELKQLDYYEGVDAGLYKRVLITVTLKNGKKTSAYIYVPTETTIKRCGLDPSIDKQDRWKEELKKNPELIKEFPELIS